jgi:hypothetical protein
MITRRLAVCILSLCAALCFGCESAITPTDHGALAPEDVVLIEYGDRAPAKGGAAISAGGGGHFTVPPDVFGAEVGNVLTFKARKEATGEVSGHYNYQQTFQGEIFHFNGPVTCFNVYEGNRAKVGALIEVSNDPTLPPGVFIWWSVLDNGQGANAPPDRSTIIGAGDEAANEAFCNSPAVPRFGPWDLEGGNFQVDD